MTMLRILKSVWARCTAGESPSTLPSWTHGIAPSACRVILTILRLLPCGVTQVGLSKSSVTCVCCNGQCIAPGFGECAPNGGILRSRTGKNSCRKKHGNLRTSRELSGTVNYDRWLSSRFAPAGIRSRVAQSAARIRAACQLDRSYRRSDFKKPPSTHCHVNSRIHYLDFRMAGL